MNSQLKHALKKIPGVKVAFQFARKIFGNKKRGGYSAEGVEFYNSAQAKNAGYQKYFIENRKDIYSGKVPARYKVIAGVTPGQRVLELGSADGTQCLVLAMEKAAVCGIELMEMQYQTALDIRQKWIENGIQLNELRFVHGGTK